MIYRFLAGLSFCSILTTFLSGQIVVQNLADAGEGSLREAIAEVLDGETITFAPILSGGTLPLTSGEFLIGRKVILDASSLPKAVKIDAGGLSRIFQVRTAGSLTLTSLELVSGEAQGGGAIYNRGSLTLENCTLQGNTAIRGNGSPGGLGGAILSTADITLTNCTLAGNVAEFNGGAIHMDDAIADLTHCTITRNSLSRADSFGNTTGFIGGLGSGSLAFPNLSPSYRLRNCIVSGNRGSGAPLNLPNQELNPITQIVVPGSQNLIGDPALLGPLADYGGPVRTVMPLSTSPAIDAGGATALTTDQRGFARESGSAADLGAVEIGSLPSADITTLTNPVVTLRQERNENSGTPDGLSLREAIHRASPQSKITFSPELSGTQIDLSFGKLELEKDLIIDASALASKVILSGLDLHRVFQIHVGAKVELRSLTIRDGFVEAPIQPTEFGGHEGGGVVNDGDLILRQCLLTENTAGSGGGLESRFGSRTLIDRCSFINNISKFEGGGARLWGEPVVKRSVFSANRSLGKQSFNSSGGGLYLVGSHPSLPEVSDSTFHGNSAVSGSGISINGQEIVNSTIVANLGGAGVSNRANSAFQVAVSNCILWQNGDPEISGYEGPAVAFADNNLIGVDPLLGPLQDNGDSTLTMIPLAGSPAIDPANSKRRAQYETDQRNHFRTFGSATDIGAVEFGSLAFPSLMHAPVVTTGQDLFRQASTPDPTNLSLREAIAYSAPDAVISISQNLITLTDGEIRIHHPLTINGLQASDRMIFDAQSQSRFFKVPPQSALTVTGVHFQNGRFFSEDDEFFYDNPEVIEQELGGGAIFALGDLSLQNCHFSSCRSSHFGGAIIAQDKLFITESRFADCRAGRDGGAIWAYSEELDAFTKISQSEFANNEVGDPNFPTGELGGAMSINMERATLEIDECYFHQNMSGAVHSKSFTFRINRSSMVANSGVVLFLDNPGGSIDGRQADGIVQNCTFSQNNLSEGTNASSTIASNQIDLQITHCTFNDAWPEEQSGIGLAGSIVLQNSILQNPQSDFGVPFKEGSSGNYVGPDAFLSPLGDYGGTWPTLVPLPDSPALEIGITTDLTTDQRGLQRIAGNAPDAGAVERQIAVSEVVGITDPVVTRIDDPSRWGGDPNNLSLRQAVALAVPASRITFSETFPKLTLNGPLEISRELIIDASAHPSPVQLKARPDHRALEVSGAGSLDLRHVEISGHNTFHNEVIRALGGLTLTRCLFLNNSARFAPVTTYAEFSASECHFENNEGQLGCGGILHFGNTPALIQRSSFIANTGSSGAIILPAGRGESASLTIQSSTFQGNMGRQSGGAITSASPTVIENSTIAGNSAISSGGGILVVGSTLTVSQSIIALNEAPTRPQIEAEDPTIEDSFIEGDPQLSSPGFYGGPTKTMLPILGSPVIDAGTGTTEITDQRGLPRLVGDAIDLGAAEFQGENAEFLLFFDLDSDGDGVINGLELAIGKDPFLAQDSPDIDLHVSASGQISSGYDPEFADLIIFKITRSLDLKTFGTIILSNESTPLESDEGSIMFNDPDNFQKAFYRIEVSPRD